MNRVRTGLMLAAAALGGLPALASAQDAGSRERHEWRGGGRGDAGRSFRQDGGQGRAPSTELRPAPVAVAQPQAQAPVQSARDDRGRRAGGYAHGYAGQPYADPRSRGGSPGNFQNRGGDDRRGLAGNNGDQRRPGWNDGRGYDNRRGFDNRGVGRGYDNRSAWNANRGGFRSDWRNDRRYDWRGYRNVNRGLFHSRYVAPRGYYGYRSFSIGLRLDPFLYAPNYWIDDPWEYRLPPAYGPYRWVRYYDDVLLVDIESGEVVDVIRDFFW